jgi:uncharacterized protein
MSSNVRVVVDTNIFVSAIMRKNSAPRETIRRCMVGKITPLIGTALFLEYESVISRSILFKDAPLNKKEREELLDAFLSVSQCISTYYLWRPNLKDEADNHLVELAVAGNGEYIITRNKKAFKNSELLFPDIQIVDAGEFLLK